MFMKITMFYSHDPGAAELVSFYYKDFVEKNGQKKAILLSKGYAVDVYKKQNLSFLPFDKTEDLIKYFVMEKDRIDAIITGTSRDDDSDYLLWKEAKALGIDSTAYVDHWMNLHKKFCYNGKFFTPDKICVIDEYCKDELIAYGVEGSKIEITGHPVLLHRAKTLSGLRSDQKHVQKIRKKLNLSDGVKVNLFISENISELGLKNSIGYDEFDSFMSFYKSISEGVVIVKAHPKEGLRKWSSFIERNNLSNCLLVYDEIDPVELLSISDNVGGLFSILLPLAHLAGINTVSHQPNRKGENYLKGSIAKEIKTVV
jgi:hypothetical protein